MGAGDFRGCAAIGRLTQQVKCKAGRKVLGVHTRCLVAYRVIERHLHGYSVYNDRISWRGGLECVCVFVCGCVRDVCFGNKVYLGGSLVGGRWVG